MNEEQTYIFGYLEGEVALCVLCTSIRYGNEELLAIASGKIEPIRYYVAHELNEALHCVGCGQVILFPNKPNKRLDIWQEYIEKVDLGGEL